ncbi:LOW QUALITY PROTEIN: hypothetical protein HZS_5569 [Henneguya salminicola]|nr:LOW QUALITY PROTEIN: hypothetical protein HZS_5569 [Henneguya salminicola]
MKTKSVIVDQHVYYQLINLLCNLTKASKCCDFRTCKFYSKEYQCTTGRCCHKCKVIFYI